MGASYRPENPFAAARGEPVRDPRQDAQRGRDGYRPENPFAPAPAAKPVIASGAANTALQGATFGFADEAQAALRGGATLQPGLSAINPAAGVVASLAGARDAFGKLFERNVAAERASVGEFRKENPKTAFGLEVAGGMATGMGATAPKVVASLGRRMARGAAAGAAGGGVGGFAAAEGTPVERLDETAIGMGAGAVLGGAAVPALQGIGRGAASLLGLRTATAAERNAPVMSGATAHAMPIGELGKAPTALRRTLFQSEEERAAAKLRDALAQKAEAEGLTLPEFLERLTGQGKEWHASGKPATVMDLGGENVLNLAKGARVARGQAKERIPAEVMKRAEGSGDRIVGDALEATGLGARTDVRKALKDIVAKRSEDAKPMYEAAFGAPSIDDAAVRELLKRPSAASALREAREIAAEEGTELPAFTPDGPIPVKLLHYVKLALDDDLFVKRRAPDSGGAGPSRLHAIGGTRRELLDRLDELVPDYRSARETYAGHTALKDALEQGREAMSKAVKLDDLREALEGMGASEREMFRRGMLEDFAEFIGDKHQNTNFERVLVEVPNMRERLKLLFSTPEAFDQWFALVKREGMMSRVKNATTGGSDTADKLVALADLTDANFAAAAQAAQAGPPGWAGYLTRKASGAVEQRRMRQMADALAPMLTAGSKGGQPAPDEFLALVRMLRESITGEAKRQQRGRAAGAATGAAAGSFMARQRPNR